MKYKLIPFPLPPFIKVNPINTSLTAKSSRYNDPTWKQEDERVIRDIYVIHNVFMLYPHNYTREACRNDSTKISSSIAALNPDITKPRNQREEKRKNQKCIDACNPHRSLSTAS
jgi:hypothetical protein